MKEQSRDQVHGTGGDHHAGEESTVGLAQPCPLSISSRQMKRDTSVWSQQGRAVLGNPVITLQPLSQEVGEHFRGHLHHQMSIVLGTVELPPSVLTVPDSHS